MSVNAVGEATEALERDDFEIRPEETTFTHEYTVLKNGWPSYTISTNKYCYGFFFFDWRTHFTVYDGAGNQVAHAIKNYGFTPRGVWNGSLMGWFRPQTLSDFDVYDKDGEYIGCIDGKIFDISQARFDFQNKDGTVVAYARQEQTQLIFKEITKGEPIGIMKRVFDIGTKDTWNLKMTTALDSRIALVFAAHVVKNQDYFLKDL